MGDGRQFTLGRKTLLENWQHPMWRFFEVLRPPSYEPRIIFIGYAQAFKKALSFQLLKVGNKADVIICKAA
jgi:hypothetical protein